MATNNPVKNVKKEENGAPMEGRTTTMPVEARRRDIFSPSSSFLSPFGMFGAVRDEFDRAFGRMFRDWPAPFQGADSHWALDVEENENEYIVHAEAPGFEPEDFNIHVHGEQLVLEAVKKEETEEKKKGFRQWSRRELFRSVPLPGGVNAEKVEAAYKNGVLTIHLPKTEESKPKRITVKS